MFSTRKLSSGTRHSIRLPIGRAIRMASKVGAHEVAIAHNHPTESSAPSPNDIGSTNRLREMLWIAGIGLRDHLIVSSKGVYSMADYGPWAIPSEKFSVLCANAMQAIR
jgi:DNA repair protein RadC